MKKMPLGKLSRRQMQAAYSVLSELQKEVSGGRNPNKILDASNRFYTLIPHDFGMKKPPLLDSEDIIKVKTMMVDSLLEIEVAYSMLKKEEGAEGGQPKDPLDVHYEKLKTDMDVSATQETEPPTALCLVGLAGGEVKREEGGRRKHERGVGGRAGGTDIYQE